MTNRERIKRAFSNQPVDRVPVAFFHHFTSPYDWNMGLSNPEALEANITLHKASLEKFVPDIIKIMNDTLMMMPLDVSGIEKASDLYKIKKPMIDSPYAKAQIDLTKRVMEIYEGVDAPVYVTCFSAAWVLRNAFTQGLPVFGAQEDTMQRFMREDPVAVKYALDIITEGIIDLNRVLLTECGADGIYLSCSNQGGFFNDVFHKKYVAPTEKKILDEAKKIRNTNILHICGYHGHGNDLRLYKGYDAAAYSVAVVAEGTTLSDAKKLFKGKCIIGGFSQDGIIYKGSKEELEKATYNLLSECGQTGIILGADCTVPNDIDEERFNWVRESCKQFASCNSAMFSAS